MDDDIAASYLATAHLRNGALARRGTRIVDGSYDVPQIVVGDDVLAVVIP